MKASTDDSHPAGLFREAAQQYHAQRLYGSVRIYTPMSWHIVGALLLAMLIAGALFVGFARVASTRTVRGVTMADRLAAPIRAALNRDGHAGATAPDTNRAALGRSVETTTAVIAELYAPGDVAGLLEPGDELRLSFDAYPDQTYGTVRARVLRIAHGLAAARSGADGRPVYTIFAALPQSWIDAAGQRHVILQGMKLSARIVTGRRTLAGSLFGRRSPHGAS